MPFFDFSKFTNSDQLAALKMLCTHMLVTGQLFCKWGLERPHEPWVQNAVDEALKACEEIWTKYGSRSEQWEEALLELNPDLKKLNFRLREIPEIPRSKNSDDFILHLQLAFEYGALVDAELRKEKFLTLPQRCMTANAHLPFLILTKQFPTLNDLFKQIESHNMYSWLAHSSIGCECWSYLAQEVFSDFNLQLTPNLLCVHIDMGEKYASSTLDALRSSEAGCGLFLQIFNDCIERPDKYATSLKSIQDWLYKMHYMLVNIGIDSISPEFIAESSLEKYQKVKNAMEIMEGYIKQRFTGKLDQFKIANKVVLKILEWLRIMELREYLTAPHKKEEMSHIHHIFLARMKTYAKSLQEISTDSLNFWHFDVNRDRKQQYNLTRLPSIIQSRRASTVNLMMGEYCRLLEFFVEYAHKVLLVDSSEPEKHDQEPEPIEFVEQNLDLLLSMAVNFTNLISNTVISIVSPELLAKIDSSLIRLILYSITHKNQERAIAQFIRFRERLISLMRNCSKESVAEFKQRRTNLFYAPSYGIFHLILSIFKQHNTMINPQFIANIKNLMHEPTLKDEPVCVLIHHLAMIVETLSTRGRVEKKHIEGIKSICSTALKAVFEKKSMALSVPVYFFLSTGAHYLYSEINRVLSGNITDANSLLDISTTLASFYHDFSNMLAHITNLTPERKKLEFLNLQQLLTRSKAANIKDKDIYRKIIANAFFTMQLVVSERNLTRYGYLLYELIITSNDHLNNIADKLIQLCADEIQALASDVEQTDRTEEFARGFFNQLVDLLTKRPKQVQEKFGQLRKMPTHILGTAGRKLPELQHWVNYVDEQNATAWQIAARGEFTNAKQWLEEQGCDTSLDYQHPLPAVQTEAAPKQPSPNKELITGVVTSEPGGPSTSKGVLTPAPLPQVSLRVKSEQIGALQKIRECAASLVQLQADIFEKNSSDPAANENGLFLVSKMRIILFYLKEIKQNTPSELKHLFVDKDIKNLVNDVSAKMSMVLESPVIFAERTSNAQKFIQTCCEQFVKFAEKDGEAPPATAGLASLLSMKIADRRKTPDAKLWEILVNRALNMHETINESVTKNDTLEALYNALIDIYYFLKDKEWRYEAPSFRIFESRMQVTLPALRSITVDDITQLIPLLQEMQPLVEQKLAEIPSQEAGKASAAKPRTAATQPK